MLWKLLFSRSKRGTTCTASPNKFVSRLKTAVLQHVRRRAWSYVVVRGRARSCAVVRGHAWSCVVMRGHAWSVVRGRAWSCVVVRGRAWSCVDVCGKRLLASGAVPLDPAI